MAQTTVVDEALAEVIPLWLRLELPADDDLVNQMTELAMSYRATGASMDETCEWLRLLVRGWLLHPSTGPRLSSRPVPGSTPEAG